MKKLVRLAGAFALPLALSALPGSALAQLAEGTSTFTGTVPDNCSFTNGTQNNIPLTLVGTTLAGTSNPITVVTNGNVDLQLEAVTETLVGGNAEAAGVATLASPNTTLEGALTSSESAASAAVGLGNTPNVDTDVTITMTVTGADTPGMLLAAALVLDMNNKVVSPGVGGRIVVQTQAVQAGSDPGPFLIKVFENKSVGDSNSPGDEIKNVRVRPSTVFLRDNKYRRVTLSIDANSVRTNSLWLCIAEKPKPKGLFTSGGATLNIRTQSCYQRLVKK